MNQIDPDHIDVTSTAKEVGLGFDSLGAPVAVTKGVWLKCVEWTEADSERQDYQEQESRLWDVLFTCGGTLQLKLTDFFKAGRHGFTVQCIPRDGKTTAATTAHLVARPLPLAQSTWLVIDFDSPNTRIRIT